jgi:hypothetical protein
MNLYGLVLTEKQRCIWMEIYEKPDTPHPPLSPSPIAPLRTTGRWSFFLPRSYAVNRRSEDEGLLKLPPFRA